MRGGRAGCGRDGLPQKGGISQKGYLPLKEASIPPLLLFYRKLTEACQTKASKIKSTGMIGKTSTMGSKGAYASGNFERKSDMGSGERGILGKEIERMEGRVAGKVAAIPPPPFGSERRELKEQVKEGDLSASRE